MSELNSPIFKKRAAVYANGDFILVVAKSGYRSSVLDTAAYQAQLLMAASNDALGESVLDALTASRLLDIQEAKAFMATSAVAQRYGALVEALMKAHSYRSKKALFQSMMLCEVELVDDEILISPTVHEQLEGWSGFPLADARDLRLPAGTPPYVLGQSIRTALSKCE